jgi:hypothetical protein
VHEDFDRARTLLSRREQRALSAGETLGAVLVEWLAKADPLRRSEGTRHVPDTTGKRDSRYVPPSVDRHVRRRSGDRCIVPGCQNKIWVERSHRVPHAWAGGCEARHLDLLCDMHHFLYELGRLRITGPADAPVITDPDGRPFDERVPWRPTEPAVAS